MTFWTEANTDLLKELWAAGHSAGVIARHMKATRNAIIGKVHRLGLDERPTSNHLLADVLDPVDYSGRRKAPKRSPHMREADRRASLALVTPDSEPQDEPEEPSTPFEPGTGRGTPAADLSLHKLQCKYPIGDPKDAEFHFCDQRKAPHSPYCPAHRSICTTKYVAPKRRPNDARQFDYARHG